MTIAFTLAWILWFCQVALTALGTWRVMHSPEFSEELEQIRKMRRLRHETLKNLFKACFYSCTVGLAYSARAFWCVVFGSPKSRKEPERQ